MRSTTSLVITFLLIVLVHGCNRKTEIIPKRISNSHADESGIKGTSNSNSSLDDDRPITEPFLTLGDFKPTQLYPSDDPSNLLAGDAPYNHPWFQVDDQDACDKSQDLKFQVQGKDTVILIEQTSNRKETKECEGIRFSDEATGEKIKNSVKNYSMVSCSGVDLSEFNGKTWDGNSSIFMSKDIAAKCDGAQTIKFLTNRVANDLGFLKSAMFDPQGKPCTLNKTGQYYELNNCYMMLFTNNPLIALMIENFGNNTQNNSSGVDSNMTSQNNTNASEKDSYEVLLSYKAVNLRTDKSGSFFSSGKYEVVLNQFKGTIDFLDARTSPTFNLESGEKKLTGSIQQLNQKMEGIVAQDNQMSGQSSPGTGISDMNLTSHAKKYEKLKILKAKFKK